MLARFRVTLVLPLFLGLTMTGCTRPPDLIGVGNPEIPAESVPGVTRQKVFIATTRQATEVVGAFFSGERAPALGLASVTVTIPPNHVTGQLERPRMLPPDPRREFTVVDPTVFDDAQAFVAELRRELARRPPGQRKILVFIHGYNNTASDAILRLSQFVEDTGFQGVPVLFSWASAARAPRYVYDLNSALIARAKLKQVADLMWRSGPESVDVLAHSMGTFLTMEGLMDAQMTGALGTRGRIGTIILASPDIDIDLFKTQIAMLPPQIRSHMYLLVSKDDAALRLSRRIAGGVVRVGAAQAAELEGLGVTVIDLSQIDDSASGSHAKFAGSPEVVQLIGGGLRSQANFGTGGAPLLGTLLADLPIQIVHD